MDLLDIGCGSIEGTRECAALQSMRGFFGHRLSNHWDILQHVDGSATVSAITAAYRRLPRLMGKVRWAQEYIKG